MPTISVFYGIVIQMFWKDHAPPHFHALYSEYEALICIRASVPWRFSRANCLNERWRWFWSGPTSTGRN